MRSFLRSQTWVERSEVDDESIREVVFYNYRIIYKLMLESILILGIIQAARELNNMKPHPWENSELPKDFLCFLYINGDYLRSAVHGAGEKCWGIVSQL